MTEQLAADVLLESDRASVEEWERVAKQGIERSRQRRVESSRSSLRRWQLLGWLVAFVFALVLLGGAWSFLR